MTQVNKNYMEQGGDNQVVTSGGTIDVQPGAKVGRICGVDFTIGTEASDTINVALQLKDAKDLNVAVASNIRVFLSDAATGLGLTGTSPSASVDVQTNGDVIAADSNLKWFDVQTNAAGAVDLDINHVGAKSWYMVAVLPDGSQVTSGIITFA